MDDGGAYIQAEMKSFKTGAKHYESSALMQQSEEQF